MQAHKWLLIQIIININIEKILYKNSQNSMKCLEKLSLISRTLDLDISKSWIIFEITV